jgi:hypothetical protein
LDEECSKKTAHSLVTMEKENNKVIIFVFHFVIVTVPRYFAKHVNHASKSNNVIHNTHGNQGKYGNRSNKGSNSDI